MAETIANWFVTTFEGTLAREWIVFLVSLLPILELRGGIIAGFAMNMEWLPTFIIAYIGNIPVCSGAFARYRRMDGCSHQRVVGHGSKKDIPCYYGRGFDSWHHRIRTVLRSAGQSGTVRRGREHGRTYFNTFQNQTDH